MYVLANDPVTVILDVSNTCHNYYDSCTLHQHNFMTKNILH